MKTAEQYLEDYEALYISTDYEPLFASTQVEDAIKQAQSDAIEETKNEIILSLDSETITFEDKMDLIITFNEVAETMKIYLKQCKKDFY